MENELTVSDVQGLIGAAATAFGPLVSEQNQTQREAIQADMEKFRIDSAERSRSSFRAFVVTCTLLIGAGLVIGGFFYSSQYQFAYQSLTFVGGLAAGWGLGRSQGKQQ